MLPRRTPRPPLAASGCRREQPRPLGSPGPRTGRPLPVPIYIYSDIALYVIFENWHIAADKGYFYMINTEKSSSLITPKNHRDPKYYL